MESIILLLILFVLIMLGAPIGFTLILIPVVYILITDAAPMILIPSQMFSAIDAVPLTAIPFFMLTGELMTSATITDRLVDLSQRLIGRMRGSMAQANVLVSMFFAGMNGSVVADTATVGSLLVPAMKKAGYPSAFAAAITAVSSIIGGIIPPSIMMIVLANAGGISVGALFAGGIVPGIMIGLLLMIINYFIAKRHNFERSEDPFSFKALAVSGYRSSFALLIPIVLVGSVVVWHCGCRGSWGTHRNHSAVRRPVHLSNDNLEQLQKRLCACFSQFSYGLHHHRGLWSVQLAFDLNRRN